MMECIKDARYYLLIMVVLFVCHGAIFRQVFYIYRIGGEDEYALEEVDENE